MIAMPLDHTADTLNLNNVSSYAEYHRSLHNQTDGSRVAEQGIAFSGTENTVLIRQCMDANQGDASGKNHCVMASGQSTLFYGWSMSEMAVDMSGHCCERGGRLRRSAFLVFNTGTHHSIEHRLSAVLLKAPSMGQSL
jgi:hypothetical protein